MRTSTALGSVHRDVFFFGRLNIEVAVISNHFLLPASMKTWVSLRADSLASVFPESA